MESQGSLQGPRCWLHCTSPWARRSSPGRGARGWWNGPSNGMVVPDRTWWQSWLEICKFCSCIIQLSWHMMCVYLVYLFGISYEPVALDTFAAVTNGGAHLAALWGRARMVNMKRSCLRPAMGWRHNICELFHGKVIDSDNRWLDSYSEKVDWIDR